MEGTLGEREDELIREELAHLDHSNPEKQQERSKPPSVWVSHLLPVDPLSDPNKHRFNHYADKQLQHLVVAEEFDFLKIANTLSKGWPR
jgi:hypothetical protein